MNKQAYFNIKTYCDDLTERLRLVEEWKLRHPDWDTQPFRRDESDWFRAKDDEELTFKSSFDPNDLRPQTSDLLTSERWNDLMLVALSAFEAAGEVERLRADRDRWRALAEYLCQNAPSVVVPDEIACQFPDPLVVADER